MYPWYSYSIHFLSFRELGAQNRRSVLLVTEQRLACMAQWLSIACAVYVSTSLLFTITTMEVSWTSQQPALIHTLHCWNSTSDWLMGNIDKLFIMLAFSVIHPLQTGSPKTQISFDIFQRFLVEMSYQLSLSEFYIRINMLSLWSLWRENVHSRYARRSILRAACAALYKRYWVIRYPSLFYQLANMTE